MLHRARWAELPAAIAYEILALRSQVFVVEQACPYLDPDGRDPEATAEHRWLDDREADGGGGGGVVAYLRVVDGPEGARRIGRVVTRADRRGRGLGAQLVRSVVDDLGRSVDLILDAQSHLVDWYGALGFAVSGDEYLDVGIPHTPMRRAAR